MRKPPSLPLRIALGFFWLWFALAYAIADHPPPPGFVLVAVLLIACAWLVCWRAYRYLEWARQRRPHRLLRAALEGLAAGWLIALIGTLRGTGEPSINPGAEGVLILFGVLGALGVLNALAVYGVCWLLRAHRA